MYDSVLDARAYYATPQDHSAYHQVDQNAHTSPQTLSATTHNLRGRVIKRTHYARKYFFITTGVFGHSNLGIKAWLGGGALRR